MNNSSEKSLWYLFVEGDTNAFSTLFKNHYSELYGYGLKISADHMVTEDCLQSFFVYLYNKRSNLGNVVNIKSYLFVSFRRAILKAIKKERRFSSYEEIFQVEKVFAFSPEELKINQDFVKIKNTVLTTLINELSARQREVIYLKYYSGLSTNDIAEIMDISYQSVLNVLQKAFAKLRSTAESQAIQRVLEK